MKQRQIKKPLNEQQKRELSYLVSNAIALAMGGVSIALSSLGVFHTTIGIMLGFGIAFLAIAGIMRKEK
jgi:hypothetical protein